MTNPCLSLPELHNSLNCKLINQFFKENQTKGNGIITENENQMKSAISDLFLDMETENTLETFSKMCQLMYGSNTSDKGWYWILLNNVL